MKKIIYALLLAGGSMMAQNKTLVAASGEKITINPANITPEPWFNNATRTGATANTQNIYQMGYVGIGTTAPASQLSIVNGTNGGVSAGVTSFGGFGYSCLGLNREVNTGAIFDSNVPGFQFTATKGGLFLQDYNGDGSINSTPLTIIGSSGFIGVKTNSPASPLSVGDNTGNGEITIGRQLAGENREGSQINFSPGVTGGNGFFVDQNGPGDTRDRLRLLSSLTSTGITIDANGRVGIGHDLLPSVLPAGGGLTIVGDGDNNDLNVLSVNTDPPQVNLTVPTTSITNGANVASINLGAINGTLSYISAFSEGVSGSNLSSIVLGASGQNRLVINGTGNATFSGSVTCTSLTQTSDARFKTNIQTIPNALNIVNGLRGTTYDFDTAKFPKRGFASGKQYGVIAQEVEKVLPNLVITHEDGYKSVNYTGMIPVLLQAVKEQQKAIELKDAKIKAMEDRLQKLESAVNQLLKK